MHFSVCRICFNNMFYKRILKLFLIKTPGWYVLKSLYDCDILEQGPGNYNLWIKFSPLPVSLKNFIWTQPHPFTCYPLQRFSCYKGRAVTTETSGPQKRKYLLCGPLQKKFARALVENHKFQHVWFYDLEFDVLAFVRFLFLRIWFKCRVYVSRYLRF